MRLSLYVTLLNRCDSRSECVWLLLMLQGQLLASKTRENGTLTKSEEEKKEKINDRQMKCQRRGSRRSSKLDDNFQFSTTTTTTTGLN